MGGGVRGGGCILEERDGEGTQPCSLTSHPRSSLS